MLQPRLVVDLLPVGAVRVLVFTPPKRHFETEVEIRAHKIVLEKFARCANPGKRTRSHFRRAPSIQSTRSMFGGLKRRRKKGFVNVSSSSVDLGTSYRRKCSKRSNLSTIPYRAQSGISDEAHSDHSKKRRSFRDDRSSKAQFVPILAIELWIIVLRLIIISYSGKIKLLFSLNSAGKLAYDIALIKAAEKKKHFPPFPNFLWGKHLCRSQTGKPCHVRVSEGRSGCKNWLRGCTQSQQTLPSSLS